MCPNCGMGNSKFNGRFYECPDCYSDWDESDLVKSSYNYEVEEYNRLIRLKEPFFVLETGQLYQCDLEYSIPHGKDTVFEEDTIMALASEKGRNRQFILLNAKELIKLYPEVVKEIINMDFETIMNDGLIDYPSEFESMTNLIASDRNKDFFSPSGMHCYEFKKVGSDDAN